MGRPKQNNNSNSNLRPTKPGGIKKPTKAARTTRAAVVTRRQWLFPPRIPRISFNFTWGSLPRTPEPEPQPNTKTCGVNLLPEEALETLRKVIPRIPDDVLNGGKFLAWPLSPEDEEFWRITTYINNSQDHGFRIEAKNILRISRPDDLEFDFEHTEGIDDQFRMMLWHGTKPEFVGSILENGFRKPEVKYQMFGQGLYFADRVSKSANYCDNFLGLNRRKTDAGDKWLFLCHVFLGRMFKADSPKHNYQKPPTCKTKDGVTIEYDSVLGTGVRVPDRKEQLEINGCVWPLGKTVQNPDIKQRCPLIYNEYVVYNREMVQPKYLIRW